MKRKGARTDLCGTQFLRRRKLLLWPFPVVRVKLRLRTISMIMRTMCYQVAISAACRWGHDITQCRRLLWDIEKHSSGLLLSWKAILDVVCQQCDLIYGRPPMSKIRLLLWEQWVDDWFDTSVDECLEDFKGDTQQRYRAAALWVPQWLFRHRDSNYQCSSPDLWEFWVGVCTKKGSHKTKILEPARGGVWTPRRWNPMPETFLVLGAWGQQQASLA